MKNIVFLDRDGVINQDSPLYIKSPDEFHFIEGSVKAFENLKSSGLEVIIITNQSVINRGMVTQEVLDSIFDKMRDGVRKGSGDIKDIFFCKHTPDEGCDCRKPKPGLINQAKEKYGIDLTSSVMVGDSTKDILAGKAAGCSQTVLVKTGNGLKAIKELNEKGVGPDYIAENLLDASNWIIKNRDE
ncbi:MAG: D-glycero-beta-D-manno-heptose 1,7-bisphosphate 7-phosphatase [Desulfobacterales bacterium]|nr:D-glycero-beta-D-manno-heptose 1,7-bisphosphate 7-phosphatase [Desulfobacterales bacterium]MCP4161022.1 D-glycero-beta-D-manno-heptose 1,7-bisphosphate 7-phosphatase [Deltaproteobacteria bacterium]